MTKPKARRGIPRSIRHPEDGNAKIQERRRKAFALRTEQRMSFRRIAEAMREDPSVSPSYDQTMAKHDVDYILEQYRRENVELAGVYVEAAWLELESNKQGILDNIKKLQSKANNGDILAIRAIVSSYAELRKQQDQQNRLRGLYPKEVVVQQTNQFLNIGETSIDLSDRSQTLALARAFLDEDNAGN